MATATLRPQDFINYNRYHTETLNRPRRNSNPRRRRRSQTAESTPPVKNMVMGQVKILKRGEVLDALKLGRGDEDMVLSSTDRLGPDPDTVQKQIKCVYAGSGVVVASPPPSSLPIPAFFGKREERNVAATCDLRRLLRLDVI